MSVFVQKFNALSGTTEWEVQDENYDFHQEIARSAFADMLHDSDRNKKYYAGLKKAIDQKHANGEKANVLDIGTGTGLLSMMAAKCGADSIVACEAFAPIASIARDVISANGYGEVIKVISKRSTDLDVVKDMGAKANILVAEVFDTELIGEGAISTFNHARENLLEDDAIVVPRLGRVYAAVINSSWLRSHNSLEWPSWLVPENIAQCPGSSSLHDIQASKLSRDSFKMLSDPVTVFQFDFEKAKLLKRDDSVIRLQAKSDGMAHGVIMWWDLVMDHDDEVIISCAPDWQSDGHEAWRDHWMQAVFYFDNPVQLAVGESFHLVSSHDEYSLWFNVSKTSECLAEGGVCTCGLHATWPRSRLAEVNQPSYWDKHLGRLTSLIDRVRGGSILFLGDSTLLPLACANLTQGVVYCVEPSGTAYKVMKGIIRHNRLQNKVVLLPSYDPTLIKHEIIMVYGEPYFRCCLYPWEGLRFWSLFTQMVQSNGNILLCPDSVDIVALPVSFDHLHKIRLPLGTVEGFDMVPFDNLIKESSDLCDSNMEVQPLWEYDGIALAEKKVIASFNMTLPLPSKPISLQGIMPVSRSEPCNGVVVWCDWKFEGSVVTSSGPLVEPVPGRSIKWNPTMRQAVYIPQRPARLNAIPYSLTFDTDRGAFTFAFNTNT